MEMRQIIIYNYYSFFKFAFERTQFNSKNNTRTCFSSVYVPLCFNTRDGVHLVIQGRHRGALVNTPTKLKLLNNENLP